MSKGGALFWENFVNVRTQGKLKSVTKNSDDNKKIPKRPEKRARPMSAAPLHTLGETREREVEDGAWASVAAG